MRINKHDIPTVIDDAEVILFSPTHAHRVVLDHMREKMGLPA